MMSSLLIKVQVLIVVLVATTTITTTNFVFFADAAFSQCEAEDLALKECTDSVLAGETVNTCSGEYRAALNCNEEVLEDLPSITGIDDCSGFHAAWVPFCSIDNCPDCSETELSCENVPFSCGNTCVNGGTCANAALALNRCMRNQGGDNNVKDVLLGPCVAGGNSGAMSTTFSTLSPVMVILISMLMGAAVPIVGGLWI